ncbi:MAG: restriction endonuclease [Burkholderiaceae bacterium]|nr:restriction endonuclease [Burkholderiaceae bacterium]
MRFKMAHNSLFAILLRSAWWWSLLIACLLVAVAHALLPRDYAIVGSLSAVPFLGIGVVAAWRQWRRPSERQVQATLDAASALPFKDFARVLADGLRRDGHEVTLLGSGGADLRLEKNTRVVLVSARRWKAVTVGAEPLRELAAAARAAQADAAWYVGLGDLTDNARSQAAGDGTRLIGRDELARLLHGLVPSAGQGR